MIQSPIANFTEMLKQNLTSKFLLALCLTAIMACGRSTTKEVKPEVMKEPVTVTVMVGGMFCTDCEATIQKRVGDLDGIRSVKASYKDGSAVVEFLPDKVVTARIREAITGSGYTVRKFVTN